MISLRALVACAGLLSCACSLAAPSDEALLGGGGSGSGGTTKPPPPRPDSGAFPLRRDVVSDLRDERTLERDPATFCTDAGDCGSGLYCGRNAVCTPCSDLTALDDLREVEFGEGEPLTAINVAVSDQQLRHPRAFGEGPKLFYVRDFFGGRIWLTPDMHTSAGAPLLEPISAPDARESAPLVVDQGLDAFSGHNFFFDRGWSDPPRGVLYGAKIDASGTATEVTELPAPFNSTNASYAVALSRTRAFWTQNLDGELLIRLMTAPLEGEVIRSTVEMITENGCRIFEFGYTPWVTPEGRILMVSISERDQDCNAGENSPQDVAWAKLDASGQPAHPLITVRNVNQPGTSETDGSLSPDLCWFYFASNRGESNYRLYRARRVR